MKPQSSLAILLLAPACLFTKAAAHHLPGRQVYHTVHVRISASTLSIEYLADLPKLLFLKERLLYSGETEAVRSQKKTEYFKSLGLLLAMEIHVEANGRALELRPQGDPVVTEDGKRSYVFKADLPEVAMGDKLVLRINDKTYPDNPAVMKTGYVTGPGWRVVEAKGFSGKDQFADVVSPFAQGVDTGSRALAIVVQKEVALGGQIGASQGSKPSATSGTDGTKTAETRPETPSPRQGSRDTELSRVAGRIESFFTSQQSGTWALAIILAFSFAWGALHALTPGHGKTLVAAYLVGTRGTVMHAVYLGLITTIAHTGAVMVLFLILMAAESAFQADRSYVADWLSLFSGFLVAAFGAWLFWRRIRARAVHSHSHPHPHAGTHIHSHAAGQHEHDHSHGALEERAGDPHEHTAHAEDVAGRGTHVHETGDAHHKHFTVHGSALAEETAHTEQDVSWASLVWLGVSGGIVPCPAALVILLVAWHYHRLVPGLLAVVVFSAGLAAVLTCVGVSFVTGKRVLESIFGEMKESTFKIVSIASAALITLLGLGMTIRALRLDSVRSVMISHTGILVLFGLIMFGLLAAFGYLAVRTMQAATCTLHALEKLNAILGKAQELQPKQEHPHEKTDAEENRSEGESEPDPRTPAR